MALTWARVGYATSTGPAPADVLVIGMAVIFASLIIRTVIIAFVSPGRRVALAALAAGLVLWVAGAMVLNASSAPQLIRFPAPGEWFFLSAYIGFSTFLVLDRAGASRASAGGWLDAVIVCGGAAGLAGFLLITPLAGGFQDRDVSLLTALIYPLLDLVLLLLVLGQVILRQRSGARVYLRLIVGLTMLMVADTSFLTSISSGTYGYGVLADLAWCAGFLLLVDAAGTPASGRPRSQMDAPSEARAPRPSSIPVVGAAAIALTTLTAQPPAAARPYVLVPAVATLTAVGLRLVLALRESRQMNEALRLSRTDELTGLPNRRAMNDRLSTELRHDGPLGLLLLDLDGFKDINDTLGHTAGDSALQAIAARVQASADRRGLAVRLGGDEFAVLIGRDDPLELVELAHQLREVVHKPVRVDGLDVAIGASVGIAIRTADTARPADLLRQADIAMYQAKASGSGAQVYDAETDEFSRERLRIAEELRTGIESGQLEVWYQPKILTATGRPHGVEALVRWRHPTQGLIPPVAFLPAARRAGLMPSLTMAVLTTVVADLSRWRTTGLQLQAAVNVAPTELLAPKVMTELFTRVRASGLADKGLIIEVTEDSFLADPARARDVIEEIRAEGLEVSIDDYGTGYSSLSYLRDLPVQELKIDRCFVAGILTNPRDRIIVKATHELARGLGLRTVAEGVEDAATVHALREIGIDVLQGYHFARPMPGHEVADWFERRLPARRSVTAAGRDQSGR